MITITVNSISFESEKWKWRRWWFKWMNTICSANSPMDLFVNQFHTMWCYLMILQRAMASKYTNCKITGMNIALEKDCTVENEKKWEKHQQVHLDFLLFDFKIKKFNLTCFFHRRKQLSLNHNNNEKFVETIIVRLLLIKPLILTLMSFLSTIAFYSTKTTSIIHLMW